MHKTPTPVCDELSIFCVTRATDLLSLQSLYYAIIHPHLLYCINITPVHHKLTLFKKYIMLLLTNHIFKYKIGILPHNLLIQPTYLNLIKPTEFNYAPTLLLEQFPKNLSRDANHLLCNTKTLLFHLQGVCLISPRPIDLQGNAPALKALAARGGQTAIPQI